MKTDIDTQIESLLDKWLDDAMSTSYIGVGIDGYKGETDSDKIEELRTADFEKYRSDTTKAIKALLDTAVQEARIDELEMLPRITYTQDGEVSDISILLQHQHIKDRMAKLKSTSKEDKNGK